MAEINKQASNSGLAPELIKLHQILKKIDDEVEDGMSSFHQEMNESSRDFQETISSLQEAKQRGYISHLAILEGRQPSDAIVMYGLTPKGRYVLNNPEKLNFEKESSAFIDMSTNQSIRNSVVHGSVLAAKTIENCLNTVQESKADDGVKDLLTQLLN